jgi:hypothetical protein
MKRCGDVFRSLSLENVQIQEALHAVYAPDRRVNILLQLLKHRTDNYVAKKDVNNHNNEVLRGSISLNF